jgi:hypothetical protein
MEQDQGQGCLLSAEAIVVTTLEKLAMIRSVAYTGDSRFDGRSVKGIDGYSPRCEVDQRSIHGRQTSCLRLLTHYGKDISHE